MYRLTAALLLAIALLFAAHVQGAPEASRRERCPFRASKDVCLPQDPLQRCATKAVRGDFDTGGKMIPQWKWDIYVRVLEQHITVQGLARLTRYCRFCAGTNCCDGSKVRPGICAASRNIPTHSIVWAECVGLMLVTDTGGGVRVQPGRSADFDQWVPRCPGNSRSQHTNCWNGPGTVGKTAWAMIVRGDGDKQRDSNKYPKGAAERGLSR